MPPTCITRALPIRVAERCARPSLAMRRRSGEDCYDSKELPGFVFYGFFYWFSVGFLNGFSPLFSAFL